MPEVLLSGDHARIARWRRAQSLARTLERRPDLIARRGGLTDEERRLIDELAEESSGSAIPNQRARLVRLVIRKGPHS